MRMCISYSLFEQEVIQLYKYEIYTSSNWKVGTEIINEAVKYLF